MFRNIKLKAQAHTQKLARIRGEYPDGIGTGCRNAHLLAIAPNSNSSIILDTSPSIEPWAANAFTHRTRAGSFLSKNKYLDKLLQTKGLSDTEYDDLWQSIILHEGSVQHLDILTDKEKSVYKTAYEIDQRWVITHAGDRQQYICQGQSVNLFFPSGSDKAYVNQCHIQAWHAGLKSLYYLRTTAGSFAEKISKPVINKVNADECIACQG
jgi:ribonucleoside-diphosphate reductase alpha chain